MKAVNLLPDQHRRGPRPGRQTGGAYVVVGVLAVLLVMALAYTLVSNQANSRKTEAAVAKKEADEAEARANALGAFGNFAQIKETRTASVKSLAEGRFDWERFLRELSAVLPKGGWLQDVNASVTGLSTEEAGPGQAQAAAVTPEAQLTGCTQRQSQVAALMVRLRKLYLVENVELKSAERGEASGAPSVGDCGRLVKFDVTVTFGSPASKRREAPPTRHSVPARLGGGS